MKKRLKTTSAKRIMTAGGMLFAIGIVLSFVGYLSVYGEVNNCLNKMCSLGWEQKIGDISAVISYAGLGLVFIGISYFLYTKVDNKMNRHY